MQADEKDKVIDYLDKNKLEVALIGAGILVLVVVAAMVIVGCCCCYCRRRRRRGYMAIEGNSGRYVRGRGVDMPTSSLRSQHGEETLQDAMQRQRMEREQSKREMALLDCQFYIRSNANSKYVLESQLPDIGSRVSKSWFLIRPIDSSLTNTLLLSMLPISQHCKLTFDSAGKEVLHSFFRALNHPYIHRIVSIDYLPNKNMIAILEHYSSRGSLKDLIYQTTPSLGWSTKYSVRRNSIKLTQIQNFGRQILEAIAFLHDTGLYPIGQIQSGNIYIEGGKCRLSGFDNTLLGYRPRIHRLLRQYKTNIDSAMFGHLLYEVGSGRELTVGCPSEDDLTLVRHPPVVDALKFIFYNESGQLPSIPEIIELQFFKSARTTDLDRWNADSRNNFVLTEDLKELIAEWKRPRVRTRGTTRALKSPVDNSPAYPIFTTTSPSRVTKSLPSPQAQPTAHKPPPTTTPPPTRSRNAHTNDRAALHASIHKGTQLRPTVTNDRSAPMI